MGLGLELEAMGYVGRVGVTDLVGGALEDDDADDDVGAAAVSLFIRALARAVTPSGPICWGWGWGWG